MSNYDTCGYVRDEGGCSFGFVAPEMCPACPVYRPMCVMVDGYCKDCNRRDSRRQPCFGLISDDGTIEGESTVVMYPKPYEPPVVLLGDRIHKALAKVGVTPDRVSAWIGRSCWCDKVRRKLNAVDAWARNVIGGSIDVQDGESSLMDLMSND